MNLHTSIARLQWLGNTSTTHDLWNSKKVPVVEGIMRVSFLFVGHMAKQQENRGA